MVKSMLNAVLIKRKIMKIRTHPFVLLLLALGLSACAPAMPAATPTALPSPTALPTRISAHITYPPLIMLPVKQQVFYGGDDFLIQSERIQGWLDYWIICDNPPFDPAAEMYFGMVFDDPENPTESLVVIDSGDALYATPVSNGEWLDPPTTACQGTLDPAYAPLLLASGDERQWLRVRWGRLVRVDAEGQVVAIVAALRGEFDVTMEKLLHQPADYEYLLAHLDEFVQGPSPWEEGVEKFNQWIDWNLDPVLGDIAQRDPSVIIDFAFGGYEMDTFDTAGNMSELPIGKMPFFYFLHNGTIFPVYIVNGQQRGTEGTLLSMGVVLVDYFGMDGLNTMRIIHNGDQCFFNSSVVHSTRFSLPEEILSLIETTNFGTGDGFYAPKRTLIGFGAINFVDPKYCP
jgi:hypothetical protein